MQQNRETCEGVQSVTQGGAGLGSMPHPPAPSPGSLCHHINQDHGWKQCLPPSQGGSWAESLKVPTATSCVSSLPNILPKPTRALSKGCLQAWPPCKEASSQRAGNRPPLSPVRPLTTVSPTYCLQHLASPGGEHGEAFPSRGLVRITRPVTWSPCPS